MAEVRTPTVTSQRSNVDIDHEDGQTVVTLTQRYKIEGDIPTGDLYRMMGGVDKTMLTRFSKAAIKHMPQLPAAAPDSGQPMYWNGEATQLST